MKSNNFKTKITQINRLIISLVGFGLVACGGGGSSSGGGSSANNFTQITPSGGMSAPQNNVSSRTLNPLPSQDYFTVLSMSNNGGLYAGTAYGFIYQVANANSGFSSMGTPLITPLISQV